MNKNANGIKVNIYKDFPSKGINFIDLTPGINDKNNFDEMIIRIAKTIPKDIDFIISPESRGFIFGAPIANKLKLGFIPVRKPGKYPNKMITKGNYDTEYSTDTLCILTQDLTGKNIWFVDDIYATGGTFKCTKNIINSLGGKVVGATCVFDIGIAEDYENIYFAYEKDELIVMKEVEINE